MVCLICKNGNFKSFPKTDDWEGGECIECGEFKITSSVLAERDFKTLSLIQKRIILYNYYKQKKLETNLIINSYNYKKFLNEGLPTPLEQAQKVIEYFGNKSSLFGEWVGKPDAKVCFVEFGIIDVNNKFFAAIVNSYTDKGYLQYKQNSNLWRLTLEGWEYYEKSAIKNSKTVFIARKFDDDDNKGVDEFSKELGTKLKQENFELLDLKFSLPEHGLIDARIEREIKKARVVISDLTYKNAGAYWEAGMATGLGKPVIYTCEKDFFDNKEKGGTHFDTNHHTTIKWSKNNEEHSIDKAANTIVDMIKNITFLDKN